MKECPQTKRSLKTQTLTWTRRGKITTESVETESVERKTESVERETETEGVETEKDAVARGRAALAPTVEQCKEHSPLHLSCLRNCQLIY